MTELNELEWEAGGLLLKSSIAGIAWDDGLDDVGELDGDDHEAAGDGVEPSRQRLTSRAVTIALNVNAAVSGGSQSEIATEMQQTLDAVRKIISPLPDRMWGSRTLRFRRMGEVTKRLTYRPARGKPLDVLAADEDAGINRLARHGARILLHLEATDPIIYSDAATVVSVTAGTPFTVTNAGSFTATGPSIWELTAEGATTVTHNDHAGEVIVFPSTGHLTVTRRPGTQRPEIVAPGTYGVCHGPGGTPFVRWPLLRPGTNSLTADRDCTFTYRSTW